MVMGMSALIDLLPTEPPTARELTNKAAFDSMWTHLRASPVWKELNRIALGAEYPDDIEFFSACTRALLDRSLACLALRPGDLLVDLGCGFGGPGQWLARQSDAHLVGIDLSQAAIDGAREDAAGYLRPDQFAYHRGTVTATRLPDSSVDGVVSIDALPMATDRAAALSELRRILRAGSRAVFTCAEWHGNDPLPHPRMATQWEPLIDEAGLVLVDRHVDEGKQTRQLRLYDLWLEHEAELTTQLGPTADLMLSEARHGSALFKPSYQALLLTVERPCGPA